MYSASSKAVSLSSSFFVINLRRTLQIYTADKTP